MIWSTQINIHEYTDCFLHDVQILWKKNQISKFVIDILLFSFSTVTLVSALNFRLWIHSSKVRSLSTNKYNYEILLFVFLTLNFTIFFYFSKFMFNWKNVQENISYRYLVSLSNFSAIYQWYLCAISIYVYIYYSISSLKGK